jgi:hypothetical protein
LAAASSTTNVLSAAAWPSIAADNVAAAAADSARRRKWRGISGRVVERGQADGAGRGSELIAGRRPEIHAAQCGRTDARLRAVGAGRRRDLGKEMWIQAIAGQFGSADGSGPQGKRIDFNFCLNLFINAEKGIKLEKIYMPPKNMEIYQ